MVRGGSGLSKALSGLIRIQGGAIVKRCKVTSIGRRDDGVFTLEVADGKHFCAGKVISAIHPSSLLQLLPEKVYGPDIGTESRH
ncbi:MAG: FAD-dependent oxidoreductase [Candidatus Parvibacillus calidus]|nr:MAG: FAD-dependent oxidoreductase [Candidatus Parvibacillus calidus]